MRAADDLSGRVEKLLSFVWYCEVSLYECPFRTRTTINIALPPRVDVDRAARQDQCPICDAYCNWDIDKPDIIENKRACEGVRSWLRCLDEYRGIFYNSIDDSLSSR